MAMLAAPRRKQKFSIDPRGSSWSKDDTKFGQKMLEKMGWSKGRGLGANEDGRTEHVKISLKDDTRGVGCSKSQADNWIEHQDDFNSLLASLNQNYVTPETETMDNAKVLSLEAKSKSSKGRLHYQKFTKGKDLSSRKLEDLDCVFGRRKKKKVSKEKTDSAVEENSLPKTLDSPTEQYGVQTFQSADSIQGYFARKMAKLDASKGTNMELNGLRGKENDEKLETLAQEQRVEDLGIEFQTYNSSQNVQDYFRDKMERLKKDRLNSAVKVSEASGETDVPLTGEHSEKQVKKQKRKKRKKERCEEESGESVQKKERIKTTVNSEDTIHKVSCETLTEGSEFETKKKRKKDKKKKIEIHSDKSTDICLDTKNKKNVSVENLNHMQQEFSAPVKGDMDTPSRKRVRFKDPETSVLGETTLPGFVEMSSCEITETGCPDQNLETSESLLVVKNPPAVDTEEHVGVRAHSLKKKKSKKKAKEKEVSKEVENSEEVEGSSIRTPDENSEGSAVKKIRVRNAESSENRDKTDVQKKRKKNKKRGKQWQDCGKQENIKTGFTGSNLDQIRGYSNSSILLTTS